MPTLKCRIKEGVPVCPQCKKYTKGIRDYGIDERKNKNGYWFKYECSSCSTKKKRIYVKYFTNGDFTAVR